MIRRFLRRLQSQRGFALPMVILLVALLTVLLTTGLSRSRTEQQIAMASDETAAAFAIADGGLQTYLGTTTSRPDDGDSVRINITGGYASIVAHLVRQPADSMQRSLYLIRSTGVVINPDSGARAQAKHTVAEFAEWESAYMLRRAALTAANGVRRNSGFLASLTIEGNDLCGGSPIPGVRTTDTVGTFSPSGNPGLIEEGSGQGSAIAAQTLIDWSGALGDDFVPDYASFQNGSTTYPVQRIMGDETLWSGDGTGILIVSGDLNLFGGFGGFDFSGIVLVGGKIRFGVGKTVVRGLVVSGLNKQLGQPDPGRTEFGGVLQNVTLSYDSCAVQAALARLSGLAGVRNAWFDTWASY